MNRYAVTVTFLMLTLVAQAKTDLSADDKAGPAPYKTTQVYALSADSDFYLEAALNDYTELTDCEEDAKEQMAEEALALADLCPTRNIDIRLAHPVEVKNIEVTGRRISDDSCTIEAVYTLTMLAPEKMSEVEAVCRDEYNGYGASLMLDDGLWQAIQIGFGVGYSGGGTGTFEGDLVESATGNKSAEYKYVAAPTMILDAAYLYKLPWANLYAIGGAELGWVMQQKNTQNPDPDSDVIYDGGSPYIFRVGFNGGLGYRYHMRYDLQMQLGYQFQYLYRTVSSGETFKGYENNLLFGLRGAYHFHENFAVWIKLQHNTSSAIGTVGVSYEFWD